MPHLVHSLSPRLLKGDLGERSACLRRNYSSFLLLWSTERTNRLSKVVCGQEIWEVCQDQRWLEHGAAWFQVSDKTKGSPAESSFLTKAAYFSCRPKLCLAPFLQPFRQRGLLSFESLFRGWGIGHKVVAPLYVSFPPSAHQQSFFSTKKGSVCDKQILSWLLNCFISNIITKKFLLWLLSRFNSVWICVTLWTAAQRAPLSTGFSKPTVLQSFDILWP